MDKLTIFKTDSCYACREQVPQAVEIANKLGIQTEVVDVYNCPVSRKPDCDRVAWVPHMELNGQEVSLDQLRERLSKRQ